MTYSTSVSFGRDGVIPSEVENSGKKLNLSEVNPLEALEGITLPLDDMWTSLRDRFHIRLPDNISPEPLKSLEGYFAVQNTLDDISIGTILVVAKSGFVLVAKILIVVMELTLVILKGILGLVS